MNERLQILKMLEAGKITAQEAYELLNALGQGSTGEGVPSSPPTAAAAASGQRAFRVEVWEHGQRKVQVQLPFALARVALRVLPGLVRNSLPGLSPEELEQLIQQVEAQLDGGQEVNLVEVNDDDTRVIVRIS